MKSRTYTGNFLTYLLSLTAITLWGASYIWSNCLISRGVSIFYFVFVRIAIAGLLLLAFNAASRKLQTIRKKNEDGTEKQLTIDEYKNGVKQLLESDGIEIITNSTGLITKQLEIKTEISSEDIVKMSKEIFTDVALAFDIPKAAFLGEITEKADSTNEFITYILIPFQVLVIALHPPL